MKKFFAISLLIVVIAAVFVVPVFAQGLGQIETTATDVQLYVIGLAATAILYVLKLITTQFPKIKITREWVSVLIYVVALGLSFAFGGFVLPAFAVFTDPLTFVSAFFGFINALLLAMAAPVSLATLFYNLILKRVFDVGAVKAGLIEEPKAEPVMKAKK